MDGKICPNTILFPVHPFPSTTKHLGKNRLHMVFTLFVNSLVFLTNQNYNCFKKMSNLFHTHCFQKN